MGRWEPDGRGRLGQAAIELFAEHGFDNVTVAQIAARSGLTPRTFYRYFGDKQEVLFAGSDRLTETLTQAVADAASNRTPLDAVAVALSLVAQLIGGDHEHSVQRQAIISSDAGLRERELSKLAGWARSIAGALRAGGVDQGTANLAAEAGMAVFRCAFDDWAARADDRELADVLALAFADLRGMAAAT